MELLANLMSSMECYRNPAKCPHFKQLVTEEQEKMEAKKEPEKEPSQQEILDAQTQKIKDANSQIAIKSINDIDLDTITGRFRFFRKMKSHHPDSPELEAYTKRLNRWMYDDMGWQRGYYWDARRHNITKDYLLNHGFSLEQIRYMGDIIRLPEDTYFSKPKFLFWKKPLFTGSICQDSQLFIKMVKNNNLDLKNAPADQLYTCLKSLKHHDQAVDLLSQELKKGRK